MFNEGKFVHHEDGKGGHYYLDNDKRQDVTYDELKNLKDLEKYIALKGKAHDFAYKHGIGNYFSKQDGSALTMDDIYDRCNMLKNAAHYDEDNFFWLQYAPNSEYVMSQIRISNHIADINQWKKTHSDPSNIKCDIGLSIVIDKQEIRATAQAKERELYTQDVDYKIGVLEVEMNWDDKNFEDRAFVENFLQALTEGKQPKLSYNEILKYFCDIGEPHFISYLRSGSNIRRHNFQTRDNIKKVRKYQEREIAREKEKLKKQKENLERQKAREMSAMLEIPSTIKFDDIFDKVDSKTNTFVLGQRNYVLHTDGEGYYACPVKTRRGITYEDDKYKIPITENKNFMIRKKLVNMITESIIKNILMEGTNM